MLLQLDELPLGSELVDGERCERQNPSGKKPIPCRFWGGLGVAPQKLRVGSAPLLLSPCPLQPLGTRVALTVQRGRQRRDLVASLSVGQGVGVLQGETCQEKFIYIHRVIFFKFCVYLGLFPVRLGFLLGLGVCAVFIAGLFSWVWGFFSVRFGVCSL